MAEWNDTMRDALTEVMNMAVGSASELLSSMVGEEVVLNVPQLEFGNFLELYRKIQGRENDSLVAIHENFSGSFSGEAFLIFPEKQSMSLVAAILGTTDISENLSEVAREALMEIGNIILNSCLGTICNLLNYSVETSLPMFESWKLEGHEQDTKSGIFVRIEFQMEKTGTTGYLVIFMSQPSEETLHAGISKLVESYG